MNRVATALAPAIVVGLSAFLLVGPIVGVLGVVCGFVLGWSVASAATSDGGTTATRAVSEVRDARVE